MTRSAIRFFRATHDKEFLMPAFPGVDFLDFDSLLNDEELLARKTARQFVDEHVIPIIEKHNREATFPLHLVPKLGRAGIFWREPEGLRLRGNVQRGLRPGDAGTRARRLRPAQLRFRAERAGDVSHLTPTVRRSKKTSGCRCCKAEKRWAASASPSRNSGRIPAAC